MNKVNAEENDFANLAWKSLQILASDRPTATT
ncbi:MAG: hypothetical protein N4J56_000125 [Chroococcidiopsis sp. SAG 2025]|nr:hypothetical protein [Chroococcidiopsis sp. SAG 2025]